MILLSKIKEENFKILVIDDKEGLHSIPFANHGSKVVMYEPNEIYTKSGEVTVYAKLPNDFKIPTPVGNYNPDLTIVFDNKTFKHIYFVAETKGDMSSLQLKGAAQAKIACARKHFECISNNEVGYDVVDSYETLIILLTA